MTHRVLVVEDDPSVREAVTLVLEAADFEVDTAADGQIALDRLDGMGWDLVILDLMLPSVDGFAVCRAIRSRSTVPIIMLTARADTADVVAGLEMGADDYVTKPFEPSELAARARAAVRRAVESVPPQWTARDLEIDEEAFTVQRGGDELPLSATETRLLVALASRPGQVLSREALLERVWGYDYLGDSRLVDMAVLRLRTKLGEPADGVPYIETVRSVGYRFNRG
ncbi:response regulator transcription factor [Iamia sp. SCSIO 61187]|uniref:response regulator transcription factor n=1 Tax=Iamia sp. SCSIO 61187 TaxID=2722752 RepID=UPI001C6397B3|nr:response regulator transcription factor [Iamia sp. SCSIO 61187]QYG92483.1 response regulator transcription factor [Iamia sp. SCSIO 61187]